MNSLKDYLIAVLLSVITATATIRAVSIFFPGWVEVSIDERPATAGTRIAVIDMEAVANEAARLQVASGSSRLDWYQQAIQQVSMEMSEKGYYVLPRAIFLIVPKQGVVDVTDEVKQKLVAMSASTTPQNFGFPSSIGALRNIPTPIVPQMPMSRQ
jgi:Skp family chaperone for outer membrane proteins